MRANTSTEALCYQHSTPRPAHIKSFIIVAIIGVSNTFTSHHYYMALRMIPSITWNSLSVFHEFCALSSSCKDCGFEKVSGSSAIGQLLIQTIKSISVTLRALTVTLNTVYSRFSVVSHSINYMVDRFVYVWISLYTSTLSHVYWALWRDWKRGSRKHPNGLPLSQHM